MIHKWTITLDPQAGGYVATCECGWQGKRPTYYKARSVYWARLHAKDAERKDDETRTEA